VTVTTGISASSTAGAGTTAGTARRTPRRRGDGSWVDAAPFRAHLTHLMAVGRLEVPEVAVVLGLSTRAVQHLLEGRSGRTVRRISPQTARRLLVVGADDVRALRWCLTPSAAARASWHRLRADGWSAEEVASRTGFGLDELRALEHGTHCNRLLAVRLVGLARVLPGTLDDQDLVGLATAA
jgi:hypothetical protein